MHRRAKSAKAKGRGQGPPPRLSETADAGVRDVEKRLAAAQEQLAATSEILRVISSSPTDLQPVFETILSRSNRLCEASLSVLWLSDGDALTTAAHTDVSPEMAQRLRTARVHPHRGASPVALTALEQTVIHVPDVLEDPRFSPAEVPAYYLEGARSILTVPMLHRGRLVGVINTWRREPRGFTDEQIELLKTFADQALIAIENVRLLTELQEKNRALTHAHAQVTESLEQQTATSEILRAISSSPTDLQPVFDTIADNVLHLCGAWSAAVYRFDGTLVHFSAARGGLPDSENYLKGLFPMRPTPDAPSIGVRAIFERAIVHVPDSELADQPGPRESGRARGFRAAIGVPMLRGGEPIGAIGVSRVEPGAFSPVQIEMLKTFADQAVIAIENVRLFTELQTSNRDLTTALNTQTATGDILRVISRSQTDVHPVFDAIVESAVRLLRGNVAAISRLAGDRLELAAFTRTDPAGDAAVRAAFPQALAADWPHSRVVRERRPLKVTDAQSDPQLPEAIRNVAVVRGYQSLVVLPMLRHDEAIGAISVTRRESGGFTDDEISLLQTFADQAVIAIENARLLTELQARTQELTRSVEQLTALGEVGRAVSSTLDLETVLTTIVSRAVQLSGLDGGVVFEYDAGGEEFIHRVATETGGALAAARRTTRVRKGEGVVGQTAITLEPAQVPDITVPGAYESRLRDNLIESGIRGVLAVPMVFEGRLIGCLVVSRQRPGEFPAESIELLRTFAVQSALAIQNARLFQELAAKGHELAAASQHKSEFLANMSHELRTPLNAILGFSEVLAQGMFGAVNEKQAEYLHDILESGRHLLSLINDILDLSKVEAGRMELELSEFDLPQAIQTALTLVRERALRRGIEIHHAIDDRLVVIRADERKVKQVLLNLLSNAIKFTPEGGRIDVRAAPKDGLVVVSVADTGIGIAVEDLETIFQEFRQVGTADKKAEGTGLGLALAKKFVELQGGRIWVVSEPGRGSTFTFSLPAS